MSLHPGGMRDPWAQFKDEYWLDFYNYQTGHGNDQAKWEWNATKGTASGWKMTPAKPVVDTEPNYEGHLSYRAIARRLGVSTKTVERDMSGVHELCMDRFDMRRAACA